MMLSVRWSNGWHFLLDNPSVTLEVDGVSVPAAVKHTGGAEFVVPNGLNATLSVSFAPTFMGTPRETLRVVQHFLLMPPSKFGGGGPVATGFTVRPTKAAADVPSPGQHPLVSQITALGLWQIMINTNTVDLSKVEPLLLDFLQPLPGEDPEVTKKKPRLLRPAVPANIRVLARTDGKFPLHWVTATPKSCTSFADTDVLCFLTAPQGMGLDRDDVDFFLERKIINGTPVPAFAELAVWFSTFLGKGLHNDDIFQRFRDHFARPNNPNDKAWKNKPFPNFVLARSWEHALTASGKHVALAMPFPSKPSPKKASSHNMAATALLPSLLSEIHATLIAVGDICAPAGSAVNQRPLLGIAAHSNGGPSLFSAVAASRKSFKEIWLFDTVATDLKQPMQDLQTLEKAGGANIVFAGFDSGPPVLKLYAAAQGMPSMKGRSRKLPDLPLDPAPLTLVGSSTILRHALEGGGVSNRPEKWKADLVVPRPPPGKPFIERFEVLHQQIVQGNDADGQHYLTKALASSAFHCSGARSHSSATPATGSVLMPNLDPNHWMLPAGSIPRDPAFTPGNDVRAFIDGSGYMADLNKQLGFCNRGVYLSGWRVTGQQWLTPNPQVPTIDAIRNTITRGAKVRALVYLVRSTSWPTQVRVWHGADNRIFCEALVADGQEAILDDRMSPKPLSSHHQKYVVVDSNDPAHTFAYVGGIDLCFDRWDTEAHASPAERQRDLMEIYTHEAVKLLGGLPPWLASLDKHVVSSYLPSMLGWHDVQARVAGPAVRQVWDTFAARWNDRRPANNVAGLESFRTGTPIADPPTAPIASPGTCWVQVLQTLPCKNALPFAPGGEQTVFGAYRQAIDHAQHYIYIEDQYFWPCDLVPNLEAALRRGVLVLVVVARDYDLPGLSVVHQQMRARVINQLRQANAANFRILHLQQPAGGQIYVHAKTMIVDDAVAFIGSANFNHRSMTNDTELQLAIVDSEPVRDVPFGGPFNLQTVGRFVHDYRSRLWAEHLQVAPMLVADPIVTFNTLWATAPLPGGRAHPHGVGVAAPDTGFIAQFIANLLIDGNALPPLPFQLPPINVGKGPLTAAIQAALPGVMPAVMTWLESRLNPRLDC